MSKSKKPPKKTRQRKKANPKATFITFAYGGLEPQVTYCMLEELKIWPELLDGMDIAWQTAWLSRTRSIAASDFLNKSSEEAGDVLIFLDRDMIWAPGDLLYLTNKALETKGVVGTAYARRGFNIGLAPHINEPGTFTTGEDVLASAEFIGTGCVAIHRHVLERLALVLPMTAGGFYPFFINQLVSNPRDPRKINEKAYFPVFCGTQGVLDPRSDDVTFSKYAAASGSPVLVAMKPMVIHLGEHGYRPIDAQTPIWPNKQAQLIVAKAIDDPVFEKLPKEAAEFNGDPLNSVDRRMRVADQELAALWYMNKPKTIEDLFKWYEREDVGRLSLYSQARMSLGTADTIENALNNVRDLNVLDFGSGAGTNALYLMERGCNVWCIEINEKLKEFTRMRAERLGLSDKLHWINDGDPQPGRDFDLVIAMNIFQHLPYPQQALKSVAQCLKPGGKLFTASAFGSTELQPMHMNPQGDWGKILQAHGFEQREGDHRLLLTLPDDIVKLKMRPGFTLNVDRITLTGHPQMYDGIVEPELSEMVRTQLRPEDTFFDVGAHAGYFSMLAAPLCSHVVAVEPNPRTAVLLQKNVEDNGRDNVVVEEAAVSNRNGTGRFNLDTLFSLTNHLTDEGGIEVPVVSLGELITRHGKPKAIKLDLEGAEGLALEGVTAEQLDRTEWIFLEFHPGFLRRTSGMENPYDLVDRLDELGYEMVAPGSLQVITKSQLVESFEQLQQQGARLVNLYARRKRQ